MILIHLENNDKQTQSCNQSFNSITKFIGKLTVNYNNSQCESHFRKALGDPVIQT